MGIEAPVNDLLSEVREALSLPSPPVAKAIRLTAKVTQGRVADELDVHRVTVARWEAGARAPRGGLRSRYARLLRDLQEITSV